MPFDSNIPFPLLYVSRAWHQCILQANNGLSFYANIDNNGTLKEGHDHLLRYAPFVTELDVNGFGHLLDHSTGPSLSDLFTRGAFIKLTTLNMKVDAGSKIIMATRIKPALELVGSRLKHLSITRNRDHSTSHGSIVILSDIIRYCGKLVSLTIDQFPVETASLSSNMECTECDI
ncbi:predicted protein [Lichtheimia corymbifera JMRC:FSU:9682]|uniref:F-box domain-containing protein n=1 Tax=Lichtheimia corymbifera JMRC:FSU:9682 TaxID=1263082 RepID=A0A068S6S6_9FUNG|nr:predicted protein [Lichtheimia corymbifera JMRC:FSU:9682]